MYMEQKIVKWSYEVQFLQTEITPTVLRCEKGLWYIGIFMFFDLEL